MGTAFKHKNYILAASCARRLLELPEMSSERNADLRNKAMKVRQKSEQIARNESELNYDESKTFKIDCKDLVPIYPGTKSITCSYCECDFADPEMQSKPCPTCLVSQVGIKKVIKVLREIETFANKVGSGDGNTPQEQRLLHLLQLQEKRKTRITSSLSPDHGPPKLSKSKSRGGLG